MGRLCERLRRERQPCCCSANHLFTIAAGVVGVALVAVPEHGAPLVGSALAMAAGEACEARSLTVTGYGMDTVWIQDGYRMDTVDCNGIPQMDGYRKSRRKDEGL